MKPLAIRISALARADLKNIGHYTAKVWGITQCNEYLTQIDERLHKLSMNPHMGHCCDHIRKGYRRFREGEHIIFYRLTAQALDIVRILHKSMDIGNHL